MTITHASMRSNRLRACQSGRRNRLHAGRRGAGGVLGAVASGMSFSRTETRGDDSMGGCHLSPDCLDAKFRITLRSMALPSDGVSYAIDTGGRMEPHLAQEWLLTNGLGGFASSTVVGCNTRRYHGLLVAATLPPVGRVMALNRVGEILRVEGDDRLLEFSVNQFSH